MCPQCVKYPSLVRRYLVALQTWMPIAISLSSDANRLRMAMPELIASDTAATAAGVSAMAVVQLFVWKSSLRM